MRLEWDYNVAVRQLIVNVQIERKRNGTLKTIARKSGQATINPTTLDLVDRNQDGREYEVVEPATLVLKNVNNNEEYEYIISVDYFSTSSSQIVTASKSVFVDVKGEEKFVFYFIFFHFQRSLILVNVSRVSAFLNDGN